MTFGSPCIDALQCWDRIRPYIQFRMLLNKIRRQSNPADGRRGPDPPNSTGNSGSREGEFGSGRRLGRRVSMAMMGVVRTAGLASQGASAERLVDDALDGTRATAAFGTATKAAV